MAFDVFPFQFTSFSGAVFRKLEKLTIFAFEDTGVTHTP
jgi:hypothetical protein